MNQNLKINVESFIIGMVNNVTTIKINVQLEPTGMDPHVKLQAHVSKDTIKIMDTVKLSLKLAYLLLFGMVKNVKLMETALQEHTIVEVAVRAMFLAKMVTSGIQFTSNVVVLQDNNPMVTAVLSVQEEKNGFQELVVDVLQAILIWDPNVNKLINNVVKVFLTASGIKENVNAWMVTLKLVYNVFVMVLKLETTVIDAPTCPTLLGMATSVNVVMVILKLMENVFLTVEEFQVPITLHHVLLVVTLITIIVNVSLVLLVV